MPKIGSHKKQKAEGQTPEYEDDQSMDYAKSGKKKDKDKDKRMKRSNNYV